MKKRLYISVFFLTILLFINKNEVIQASECEEIATEEFLCDIGVEEMQTYEYEEVENEEFSGSTGMGAMQTSEHEEVMDEMFAGGKGTQEEPYQISTPEQLVYLADIILKNEIGMEEGKGQYYKLMNDIDLGNYNWQPIGYAKRKEGTFYGGSYFYGIFDGNGYTIRNLTINQKNPNFDNYYYGLFGWNCGTIQNLKVESAKIQVDKVSYIGGIAAVNEGIIENCSFDGVINVSSAADIGGIVGRQCGGSVQKCTNKAKIVGDINTESEYIGGLVGFNEAGKILYCVNEGEIVGNSFIGGIAGDNDGFTGEATIGYCMNAGAIEGNSYIGGIAGETFRTANIIDSGNVASVKGKEVVGGITGGLVTGSCRGEKAKVQNCMNLGKIVSSTSEMTGSVVGCTWADGEDCVNTIKNCYYLKNCDVVGYNIREGVGQSVISSVNSLKNDQIKETSSYKGFDFAAIWSMGRYYPVVKQLALGGGFEEKPQMVEISCKESYTKAYGAKKFKLNVKNAIGEVTYKSSNKKVVTVSQQGEVTIKGTGSATITITAENDIIKSKIYIVPKKAVLSSVENASKNAILVKWEKSAKATGYQIQVCRNKKFNKNVKNKYIKKASTTSVKIKNLTKNKKYYVRIRAYKTINGKKYYGTWSKEKSIKIQNR